MKKIFVINAFFLFAIAPAFVTKDMSTPGHGSAIINENEATPEKSKPERTRRISTEEYNFALTIFEREFPPRDEIFISDETGAGGAFYVRPTANNNIRMCMGRFFENGLATAESRYYFVHELTHVWQIEHYSLPVFLKEAVCNQVVDKIILGNDPNKYVCDENKTLGDYNFEQQGNIVSDYYLDSVCAKRIAKKTLVSKTWKLVIGSDGRDVAVDENGVYYLINHAGLIYKYVNNDWKQLPGSDGLAISANAGKVWMANTAGLMYELQNGAWKKMTGSDAKDLSIAPDGSVWMVNTSGMVYQFRDNMWILYSGSSVARIAAGRNKVWIVNSSGKIYEHTPTTPTGWTLRRGSDGRDIAISNNGEMFLTNNEGKIYQWDADKWKQLDGSDGRTIAANKGKVFMVNTDGRLFYRNY